jgi:hypothetical protein
MKADLSEVPFEFQLVEVEGLSKKMSQAGAAGIRDRCVLADISHMTYGPRPSGAIQFH